MPVGGSARNCCASWNYARFYTAGTSQYGSLAAPATVAPNLPNVGVGGTERCSWRGSPCSAHARDGLPRRSGRCVHDRTPWGDAINFDDRGCDSVRAQVLENVRQWIADFHLDGLRLDAVHAIYDISPEHILAEIKRVADEEAARASRHVHIIAESDLNDARLLWPQDRGGSIDFSLEAGSRGDKDALGLSEKFVRFAVSLQVSDDTWK